MHNVIELRWDSGLILAHEVRRPLPGGFRSAGARATASHAGSNDDFEQRVTSRQVDLIARINEGLPPLEYLPESEGMLLRGKRHLIAAPRKEGKSIAMLVHWVCVVLAGGRVIIFDRENGAQLYSERLQAIMTAWDLGRGRSAAMLRRNLLYFEFPRLKREDGPALAALAKGADVVVWDAQRLFLTDLGLDEDNSDDYSRFMTWAVEPLFQAGVATVILDNTGHKEKDRSRGTSAKGDLNEVLLTLKRVDPFSKQHQGRVQLVLEAGNSRFGTEGTWEMRIGGGAFEPWRRLGEEPPPDPAFRRAAEKALRAADDNRLSQTKLLDSIREAGVSFTNQMGRSWLYAHAGDPDCLIEMFEPEGPGQPAVFYWRGGNAR